MKIYCGGNLIATYQNINLDKTGRFVVVAEIHWPACTTTTINNRTWTSLVQPSSVGSPIHCSLPCTNDNNCGGGEVCGSGGTCVLD